MNISLTESLDSFVKEKVDSGLYGSSSEVIRHALRLLVQEDQERRAKLDALRAEIQLGLDSPVSETPFDKDEFLARMHRGEF